MEERTQEGQDLAAIAHAERLESVVQIERGFQICDDVDRELAAMAARSDSNEQTKFVWAAKEEQSVLKRVIRDQKAHAEAAALTVDKLRARVEEQEERERAVRAATALRVNEFQVARWWTGVQHSLALASAQSAAAEAALSAEVLSDRRIWLESLLAARAESSSAVTEEGLGALADATEPARAAAARRDAHISAAITGRIYDSLLEARPSSLEARTAEALLEASIAQQVASLAAGAQDASAQLAVDAVLDPLRAAAVLPIEQATTQWRRVRAMYVLTGPEPEILPPPVVGVVLPLPIATIPASAPEPELEPELEPEILLSDVELASLDWPLEYMDPISLDPMLDPVRTSVGCVYDRRQIEGWINRHRKGDTPLDPLTNLPLKDQTLVADGVLREEIAEFRRTGVPGPCAGRG